jgi:hypothetical protein
MKLLKLFTEGTQFKLESGIISGVHLVGLQSSNYMEGQDKPYTYDEAALREAVGMYNGKDVNLDHGFGISRSIKDKIGIVEGANYREGKGIYGDIKLNTSHPMWESIKWWVANAPDKLGMSHVVAGKYNEDTNAVNKVNEVFSVDIVSNPSTTKGLFTESAQRETVKYISAITEELSDRISLEVTHPLKESLPPKEARLKLISVLKEQIEALSESDNTNTHKENTMEWADIKLEDLKKHRADLATTIASEAVKAERELDAKVEESVKDLAVEHRSKPFLKLVREHIAAGRKDEVAELVEDRKAITKEVAESKRTQQTRETTDAGKKKSLTDDEILAAFDA